MEKQAKTTQILDGAYEVLYVVPGLIGYKGGKVDLSKINAAQAEKLVAQGFPYLRKVAASKKAVAVEEEPKALPAVDEKKK